jgi:hypothetical protein
MVYTYPTEAPIGTGVINQTRNGKTDREKLNVIWDESVKRDLND